MDLRVSNNNSEDNYSVRRPLFIADLCPFIYDCIFDSLKQGVVHFYNPFHKYTKYEICKIIAETLNINADHISPQQNSGGGYGIAPRPYDTNLRDDRVDFKKYNFTNFNKSMEACFSKFIHPKIEKPSEFFIMLDMDGTLIHSNFAHYNAYQRAFKNRNEVFMTIEEWNHAISYGKVDSFLRRIFNRQEEFDEIKREKQVFLKDETISFTTGCEKFLRRLIDTGFNFCVVTNASKCTVDIFREKIPLLGEITQWIYREDYNHPKPDAESYSIAKQKYYKNEKYVIGFEDSLVGFKSLKQHTDFIYIFDNEHVFNCNDCFLFNDYSVFF
jgi:HAD superfamily hydrolase (TIGR01509 family)